jgi:hypothetical protein
MLMRTVLRGMVIMLSVVPLGATSLSCSSSDDGGCQTDNDCKGARVCVDHACVDSQGLGGSGGGSGSIGKIEGCTEFSFGSCYYEKLGIACDPNTHQWSGDVSEGSGCLRHVVIVCDATTGCYLEVEEK